jgi:ABC-2 type transport system ATP-binding protein
VENILDDVAFLNRGHLLLQSSADELRAREGKSVDAVFREVFRC